MPPLNAMELMAAAPSSSVFVLPTTRGAHEVTRYGLVALKLTMSVRPKLLLPCLITLKLPTAYMVVPQRAIWRICSVGLDLVARRGVLLAGRADTAPGGGGWPPVPACAAGMLSGSTAPAVATTTAARYLRTTSPTVTSVPRGTLSTSYPFGNVSPVQRSTGRTDGHVRATHRPGCRRDHRGGPAAAFPSPRATCHDDLMTDAYSPTQAFRDARDLLLRLREDYPAARAGFTWPAAG